MFRDDLDGLRRVANALRDGWRRFPGLADLQVERQVRIRSWRCGSTIPGRLYGGQPAAIVEQISRLSKRAGGGLDDRGWRRRFDVVLRLSEDRRTTAGLGDLLLETRRAGAGAAGGDIRETDGPNQILRENRPPPHRRPGQHRRRKRHGDRRGGHPRGRGQGTAAARFFTSLEGTFQAQEEASRTIAALSALSLALVFAILFSRYRSAALALIIMGNVPLALIGSLAALWLVGQPLSVASMIGFITLTGSSRATAS